MRSLPDISSMGRMQNQQSVRFSIAGAAFMNCCAAQLEPLKLTPSRALAAAFLHEHPGVDQTSLGRAMGMNRSSTMLLIDNLEAAGLMRRAPGSDRRSKALYLTAQGEAALQSALDLDEKLLSLFFDWMGDAERALFARIIDQIIARAGMPIAARFLLRGETTIRGRSTRKRTPRKAMSRPIERKRRPRIMPSSES